ncbi:MAG TPA: hypothetical protein VFV32_13720 [Acidimicrobiales bacterium]|jgi:hypothetical protein|nr:hypothetical protein [Acidimicrobiales bacterium]
MDAKRADDDGGDGPWRGDEALRAAVVEAMGRIVAGDEGAVWELHEVAEPSLARMLRAEARRIDVRIEAEEIWELTLDAAETLAGLAPAWRPDGALPWVWARLRIAALVQRHVGTFAGPLDDEHLELEAPAAVVRVEDPRAVLRAAARRHPAAHRLDQQLAATVSERDADIWLGVQLEKAAGNRSPAVTVGADHALQPETVRKVVQRVGERLAEVA